MLKAQIEEKIVKTKMETSKHFFRGNLVRLSNEPFGIYQKNIILKQITFFVNRKCTPLHLAAQKGVSLILQELLKNGAKIEAQDFNGQTPLHHASSRGHFKVVRCLVEHSAKIEVFDFFGQFLFVLI